MYENYHEMKMPKDREKNETLMIYYARSLHHRNWPRPVWKLANIHMTLDSIKNQHILSFNFFIGGGHLHTIDPWPVSFFILVVKIYLFVRVKKNMNPIVQQR